MRNLSFDRLRKRSLQWAIVGSLLVGGSGGAIDFGEASLAAGESQDKKDNHDIEHPDHILRSRPENVVWGEFPSLRPPVLVIQSGEVVRIETLSHAGATQGATNGGAPGNEANHPVAYLGQFGVQPDEVLQDVAVAEDFRHTGP